MWERSISIRSNGIQNRNIRAATPGQGILQQSVERMEDKLDKALEEHEDRIRALETYKDKQLGLLSLAALLGGVVTWSFDHLKGLFK